MTVREEGAGGIGETQRPREAQWLQINSGSWS
jgi:hypothetical protein